MSKKVVRHYVRGEIFENDYPKWNALAKAFRYCKENDIDFSEIYAVSSESEIEYLKRLLIKQKDGEICDLKSHEQVCLIGEFKNANGDTIPNFLFQTSFTYKDVVYNKKHFVLIVDSPYEITREIRLCKTLFDVIVHSQYYLEILIFNGDDLSFSEWKFESNEAIKELKAKEHKRQLAQKREIREQQKYDRLLKLRDEGKITERQTQELYRLEKLKRG